MNQNKTRKTIKVVDIVARLIFYVIILLFLTYAPESVDNSIRWFLFIMSILISVIIKIKLPEIFAGRSGVTEIESKVPNIQITNPHEREPKQPLRTIPIFWEIMLGIVVIIIGLTIELL